MVILQKQLTRNNINKKDDKQSEQAKPQATALATP